MSTSYGTRLYDTFLFGGTESEVDMLECRLTELQDAPVWRHVIVEARVDHKHGQPKPLYFREHQSRFDAWKHRIIYVEVPELPGPGPWERINAQREAVEAGIGDAEAGDVIMHSDVDEIPYAWTVNRLLGITGHARCEMRCAVFAVDWVLPWNWTGAAAARAAAAPARMVDSFAQLRDGWLSQRGDAPTVLTNTGWHLSWIGGPDAITAKMNAYCHTEMDGYITRGQATGQFYQRGVFWGHGQGDTQLIPADVDESWPKWVYERRCPRGWFRPR